MSSPQKESQYKKLDKKIDDTKNQLDKKIDDTRDHLDKKIDTLDKKIDDTRTQLDKKIEDTRDQLDKKIDGVIELTNQMVRKEEFNKLVKVVFNIEKDVNDLKENSATKEDVRTILGAIDAFTGRVEIFDRKVITHDERLNNIDTKMEDHEKRIHQIETTNRHNLY
ncbi:MAG: hypothetical protein A3I11_06110 [Elusimicrobia bacterium RIFCSPLOWO2_02_FULL_39_32]|nr:MAG: hypothetical protein A2034_01470 [Elusimicrobia bacterium GWA2_38_7]OGR80938.1 MAG: hypothetical protein A3B80_04645 [Elusimicrobia bacterium RIFCSPHIGHO2_02_FULL_39_36]OGR91645.1 MAG: hypothetical protein A3I11_06110 [Elusimicrobia bacterium RIFCSPLOWO2_02_FULL_39_32]OGS00896.1 MAG: hypothetical protein A3G85_00235 [Elusimicrobia bacterium RIFCSPLOWO2_12_FULL_39_28]